MIDTYCEALSYLFSLPDMERKPGPRPFRESLLLERPAALLERLGNPQTQFHSVLIAGTKGKGSTAAMLASILAAAGLRVGLYTQPHLHTYRERICLDGRMIDPCDFAAHVARVRPLVEAVEREHPDLETFTTFEVVTATALDYFAKCGVQVAVLEVGLGGRLDATNTVNADLSAITSISFDHTAILGDSLAKIASEKAGILKPGKIGLTAPQHPDAAAEIARVARERSAALGVGGRDWFWSGDHSGWTVESVAGRGFWRSQWRHSDLYVPLLGVHQLENAATAVAAVEVLRERLGLSIADDSIRRGLAATCWPGRIEILRPRDRQTPLVIADGAHNGDSAEKLVAALRRHFTFDRLWLVAGILGDKDVAAIAAPFAGITAGAWAVQSHHPRSHSACDLALMLRRAGIRAQALPEAGEAIAAALAAASPGDLVCVTGSLSAVAEARQVMGLAKEPHEGPSWGGECEAGTLPDQAIVAAGSGHESDTGAADCCPRLP